MKVVSLARIVSCLYLVNIVNVYYMQQPRRDDALPSPRPARTVQTTTTSIRIFKLAIALSFIQLGTYLHTHYNYV